MSILNGNAKDSGPNPWAKKVRVMAVASPWWPTQSIELVCEVSIANVLTTLVHVGRSKSGRLYVSAPSTKRGDSWTPIVQFLDPALAQAVEAAALAAAAGGVPEDVEAETTLPF